MMVRSMIIMMVLIIIVMMVRIIMTMIVMTMTMTISAKHCTPYFLVMDMMIMITMMMPMNITMTTWYSPGWSKWQFLWCWWCAFGDGCYSGGHWSMFGYFFLYNIFNMDNIQLLEYPIHPAAPRPSQKASHGNISGTKRSIIDPLVSKRPEKIWMRKF